MVQSAQAVPDWFAGRMANSTDGQQPCTLILDFESDVMPRLYPVFIVLLMSWMNLAGGADGRGG